MTYPLYRFLTIIAYPLIFLFLLYRKSKGKEDAVRFKERFGYATEERPEGQLVWLHAVSVGESLSILPFIERFHQEHPNWHILVTTGTVASANMMAKRLPDYAIHQYAPVDAPFAIARFLEHWQPSLVLWLESELWPNMVHMMHKACPIISLNTRISPRSFTFWQKYKKLCDSMLSCFSLFLPQSQQDHDFLTQLGAEPIGNIGNLKYASPPLPVNQDEYERLSKTLEGRQVFVAGSTHDDEEVRLAHMHKALRKDHPSLLTIIIPRHVTRAPDIINQIQTAIPSMAIARRSIGDTIFDNTDIYIADTMGELGLFYQLADSVFIGGSLIPHGGQNILEPARFGKPILTGPHMFNFTEIMDRFLSQQALLSLNGATELQSTLSSLLSDAALSQDYGMKAEAVVRDVSSVLDHVLASLSPYMASSS